MSKKVFITGASGCVGHYLIESLLSKTDYELYLLVRDRRKLQLKSQIDLSDRPNVHIIEDSMQNIGNHRDLLRTMEFVVSTAAGWGGEEAFVVNRDKTIELFSMLDPEVCERAIYFSTASIPPLPPSTAIAAATARYPGGKLAVLVLPSEAKPWFLIRLTRPEELRRTLGTTTVYVDALTGEIQSAWSPVDAPKLAYIIDSLYAVHTGEWGGFPSRLLVLATGVWIITMIILGLALWLVRQRKQRMRRDSAQ